MGSLGAAQPEPEPVPVQDGLTHLQVLVVQAGVLQSKDESFMAKLKAVIIDCISCILRAFLVFALASFKEFITMLDKKLIIDITTKSSISVNPLSVLFLKEYCNNIIFNLEVKVVAEIFFAQLILQRKDRKI